MKKLNLIIACLSLMVLVSCAPANVTTPLVLDDQVVVMDSTPVPETNPCLILGTSAGELFKTYYELNDIDAMVGMTSKRSVDKFGELSLRKLYKEMSFGYKISYKNVTKSNDSTYTLVYEKSVLATKGRLTMEVAVEEGAPKIVIKSLDKSNPFE